MLSHEEEVRLTEIEAQLVAEAPDLHEYLAGRSPVAPSTLTERAGHPLLRSFIAFVLVLAATTLLTLFASPEWAAPVAVIGLCAAGMYTLDQFGTCPGRRRA